MDKPKKFMISERGEKITPIDDPVACILLNAKDVSAIERAVGIVEGLSFVVEGNVADALTEVIETIDAVLHRKGEET